MKISITLLREWINRFGDGVLYLFSRLLTRYHVVISVVFLVTAGLLSVWIIVNSLVFSISSSDVEVEEAQVPTLDLQNISVIESWLEERAVEHSRAIVAPTGRFKREY